jgi:3-oxoacyl-(acyl-carrier-protein) synthase
MSVLITGLGVVSAAGENLAENLDSLANGRRNAGPVTLFQTPLTYPVFEALRLPDRFCIEGRRTLGLALCAVTEALGNAQLEGELSGLRAGVCMGTTVASQLNDIDFYSSFRSMDRKEGFLPMTPVDRYLDGNLADFLARKIGARGPVLTVANACSSGTDAIGIALSWLRGGLCDIAIAGGADELNRVPYCGFGSLGIVSHEMCAPFDRDRKGLSLGEGAGVVILETESSALRRGITSNVHLTGYGSSADAYHLTAPRPDGAGLKRAIGRALEESGIGPDKIDFINAHGTATPDNDKVEGKVAGELFGNRIKMVSTKGYTGHTLGAAGGIEAVYAVAGLMEGWIPGNAGFRTFDEEIGISPVIEKTSVRGSYAISTSLAFGGNNAALVFRAGH